MSRCELLREQKAPTAEEREALHDFQNELAVARNASEEAEVFLRHRRAAEAAKERERDAEWCRAFGMEPTYGKADAPDAVSEEVEKDHEHEIERVRREALEVCVEAMRGCFEGKATSPGFVANIQSAMREAAQRCAVLGGEGE